MPPKFVYETINLCGFKDRVQYLESGSYSVEKLHIPTLFSPHNEPCEETVEWLNARFLGSNPVIFEIYIQIYKENQENYYSGTERSQVCNKKIQNAKSEKIYHYF